MNIIFTLFPMNIQNTTIFLTNQKELSGINFFKILTNKSLPAQYLKLNSSPVYLNKGVI